MDAADILDLPLGQRASSTPNATETDVIVYAPDGSKTETVTDYAGSGTGAANKVSQVVTWTSADRERARRHVAPGAFWRNKASARGEGSGGSLWQIKATAEARL